MELVSIVMPVYNTPYEYLEEAVRSIKRQTYNNFELLIVDDSSTQFNDTNIIDQIIGDDARIRIIKNRHQKGVAGALNTGLDESRGSYIIRMDSDDIALPSRVENQVRYMDEHNVDILAGYIRCFGDSKRVEKSEKSNIGIRTTFLFQSGIAHPTVCIRKDTITNGRIRYCENVQSEDYDLWIRLAEDDNIVFSTLPEIILKYRIHNKQVTKTKQSTMQHQGFSIRNRYISNRCPNVSEEDKKLFIKYTMLLENVEVKNILRIENSILADFVSRMNSKEKHECTKVFRKLCAKKALSFALRGDLTQIFAFGIQILKMFFAV